jgi:transposase
MVHTMKSEEISAAKRRHHERSFKADLILQSLVPGASVSAIALAAGINANLLFKWRRDHLRAMRVPSTGAVTLVPVQLTPALEIAQQLPQPPTPANSDSVNSAKVSNEHDDVIEVEFAGARLRVRSPVDEIALVSVLRALRRSA